ncbi:phage virion morphogenesis protein [Sphingomonas sp.]|uniref:phage virion morphogenesis protein n=1 Tax=Sphingomonas sp. TaxID=28214 RepID=UPI003CC518A9
MIRIEFNVAPVLAKLASAKKLLGDLTPVHQDIAEYMVQTTKGRFITSTAPDGSRWRDKSPATLASYLRRGDGDRPKPLIGPSGRLGREVQGIATKDSAEIGSALIYSGVMQDGAAKGAFGTNARGRPIPWGAIPARVWLGISAEDERAIIEITDEHLEEATGSTGE